MKYGSVCSGIEAATQAWHPLGWKASFFSEIEDFPRAVLQHHYPDVPLHGDFTTIQRGDYDPIDLLVGGTPCQSFSIAGLRGGLGDDRGNLALEYLRLADRLRPKWLVWENVPGVLSSVSHVAPDQSPPDIDLDSEDGPRDGEEVLVTDEYESDEDHALLCFLAGARELGYYGGFRVIDAQYTRTRGLPFAVPQRRRRVIFVGHLGDWRRAAAVLFDRESLSGNSPPRRESREGVTGYSPGSFGGYREGCGTLKANGGDWGGGSETLVAFNSRQDPEVTGDRAGPLDTASPQAQAIAIQERAVSENPNSGPDGIGVRQDGSAYTLEARSTSQAVAFKPSHYTRGKDGAPSDVVPPLTADADKGDQDPVIAFDTTQITSPQNDSNPKEGDPCHPLAAGAHPPAIIHRWAVRRLTPVECERLQGFPDGFTDIPWLGKEHSPDSRRYKALGNSMAVNVMQFVGDRIELVESLT